MKRIKVYVASPYTNGWQPDNVRRQLEAKHILLDNNFVPFVPLENHYAEIFRHRPEEDWYAWDLEWLAMCDILVRLRPFRNGSEIPSPGSDGEEKRANELNKPVFTFHTIEELKEWCENVKQEMIWKMIETKKI